MPVNCIIMGWVTHAMATIVGLTMGVNKWQATVALFVITALYSTASGLWGVVVTDFFQFGLAMAGSVALAVFALRAVGGLDGLAAGLAARHPGGEPVALLPDLSSAWMPALTFFVYIAVNWWASWYPGAEPGGGGYVAQRILSTRNERHAFLAALWFNLAHYVLRPWPWILVALASMLLYPGLAIPEEGYVRVMVDHLPPVWRGFLLAAFFAAYMSTISTHLNWGASSPVGAQVLHLKESLGERLKTQVELLNPFRKIAPVGREVSPELMAEMSPTASVAVGLALRKTGD